MNDIVTQIYQTALKKAGKNGKALRDMALYAVYARAASIARCSHEEIRASGFDFHTAH